VRWRPRIPLETIAKLDDRTLHHVLVDPPSQCKILFLAEASSHKDHSAATSAGMGTWIMKAPALVRRRQPRRNGVARRFL
jgi:hypothetical protein